MSEPGSTSADTPTRTGEFTPQEIAEMRLTRGELAGQRPGDPSFGGIAEALGDLIQAAQSRGRDTKLVSAILRAMGEFIASGRDALVPMDAQGGTRDPLEPAGVVEVAASTEKKRAASMSPALKEVVSTVIGSLSDDETARYLGVGVRQVRRRAYEGSLYYFHVGRRRRYPCWQFGDQSTLPGIRIVAPAIPLSWPPQRVAKFMQTPHSRLELDGTLRSPAEWLINGGDAEQVAKLLGEKQPPEASSRSQLTAT